MTSAAAHFPTLRQALDRLVELGIVPAAGASLVESAPRVEDALRRAVLAEVPAFTESGNPRVAPELKSHVTDHIEELVRLLLGAEPGEFGFVAVHARLRAEQRFPLEAVLHAYRCGLRVISRWLRDLVASSARDKSERIMAAVADFAIEYSDAISAVMTSEYVARTRILAAEEGDRGAELLNVLLGGHDESDGRIARLLRAGGYLDQRQSYCVAVARASRADEMEQPERVQRIVTSLLDLVASPGTRALAGARGGVVVAVMSMARRLSGWTAPRTKLAERMRSDPLGMGTSVLVGLSADHPATSSIPRALREATAALEFADVAKRVVLYSDLPIRALLAHAGGAYVRQAPPAWIAALFALDAKADGHLIKTLSTLADADLNVQEAGRRLGVHPNTVYARLTRIRDATGLDGQRLHDLVEMLLAADCARW